ncbi:methionine--tRNA ligase, partial [Candidatus Uhrbacteria bacterium]|nr:methionine--tRNA ligase [Candidatus Uhrbacteria bacterium]
YSTVVADVLARWHRMQGDAVHFVTGTDENAQKNAEVALKMQKAEGKMQNEREVVKRYVDEMSAKWQMTWKELGFSHDDFIRTTEHRHIAAVNTFFKAVQEKGDIYKGKYVGYYCTGCEAYVTESDLVDGKCPLHKREPKKLEEENYFFRSSKYRDQLLAYIEKHPEFVQPASRRHEVVNYIREHFNDFSISRQSLHWGIPVPGDVSQSLYVWFDALINYLTTIGYGTNDAQFQKFWPADLHLVGKDIIKFHCALWPAMLLSAELPLPKVVFAHGFFTIDGQKISKSLGNAIDPVALTQKYSLDAVRYFLLREIPFGEDGDFSFARLEERYTSDLANGIGNLTARVITLATKTGGNWKFEIGNSSLAEAAQHTWATYERAIDEFRFHDALAATWSFITACDEYLEQQKPWKPTEKSEKPEIVIAMLLESLRHIAWLLWPVMPTTAERIFSQLGILEESKRQSIEQAKQWGNVAFHVEKGPILFPRLDNH